MPRRVLPYKVFYRGWYAAIFPYKHRHKIVTVNQGGGERCVALPLKWSDENRPDYQSWEELPAGYKRHVILSITNFPYFVQNIFLPRFSLTQGCQPPDTLWPYLRELCQRYQAHFPPNCLPYDVFEGEYNDVKRVCTVAPNRMLKTAITAYALSLYFVGVNNEIRILMASATGTLGERKLGVIRSHIIRNQRFQQVFGILHDDDSDSKWSQQAIEVDGRIREGDPTIACAGYSSGIEGTGADIGIADDVAQMSTTVTQDARDKLWSWLIQVFEKRLSTDPLNRVLYVIMTRHHESDIAGRAKEEASSGTWDYQELPAIWPRDGEDIAWPPEPSDLKDPNLPEPEKWDMSNLKDPDDFKSRLLCEDVLPLETLIDEFKPLQGRQAFYRTRFNQIRDPESRWFSRDLIRGYARADGGIRPDGEVRPQLPKWKQAIGVPEEGTELWQAYNDYNTSIDRRIVSIDTGSTAPRADTDPDWTVIQLWGEDVTRHLRILLDMLRIRIGSPARFKRILGRFLDAYQPHVIVMESNGMARWVGRDASAELGWPIREYVRGSDAVEKIENFKVLIESGLLLYCAGDRESIHQLRPFEEELVLYPDASHDDCLVAAVQAQEYFRGRAGEQTFEVVGEEEEGNESGSRQDAIDRPDSGNEDEHVPIWDELNDMQNNPENYQDKVTIFGR